MEEVLDEHPAVSEAAVFGVADELEGQLPLGLLVLESDAGVDPAEVVSDVVRHVRERIGSVASFKQAAVVARLPKTRSGKILRKVMRKMADGEEVAVPPTIEDESVLEEIRVVLADLGYPRS